MVVTGEAAAQPQLAKRVESWLREHGHQVTQAPLPPESVNTLFDCFLLDDEICARKVVELRSRSRSLVYARVQLRPGAPPDDPTLELVGYWLDPARAVAERRECERCTPDLFREHIDDMLRSLSKAAVVGTGHLYITSRPAGAKVSANGNAIGITPMTHDLPPGRHQLTIAAPARRPETREVVVRVGQMTVVDIPFESPRPTERSSDRRVPLGLMVAGGAGLVAGVTLFATSQSDDGTRPEYRDTRAAGAVFGALGLAAAGAGAYLWFRAPASTPTVAVVPGGATVGWAKSF